ncbi:transcription antitermination factor NusB [Georgenia halophila]|uniref:Transcription antitermination factor NusB n=1 Tax=Georgenia halophila TaxID=620889 RepID=A0ABP8L7W3_9MICO
MSRGQRDGSGRTRGTGPRSGAGGPAPDAARLAAYEVLRRVAESDAYANLVLPGLLRERGITGRDAAFATELTYGTLRLRARYDAVLSRCTRDRALSSLDPEVLELLRLGTHQILGMRVPVHAAVSETVALTREVAGPAPTGMVNGVLRTVSRTAPEAWLERLVEETDPDGTDPVARLSVTESHPEWITRALRQSLIADGTEPAGADAELADLLAADNVPAPVALVARPGLVEVADLAAECARESREPEPGRWSPYALIPGSGDPGRLGAVARAAAGVQDEGSQLVTLALAEAPLAGPAVDGGAADTAWLDLCAGPGGKAALLGALAHQRGTELLANEVAPHRAGLVRGAVAAIPAGTVEIRVGDGRELEAPGRFDRVLVDAPCTGLGALRRRPEARWRRTPADLAPLGTLQRELLAAALDATRAGGVVAYVTCSPHIAETQLVVDDTLRRRDDVEVLDAAEILRGVSRTDPLLSGPYAQLWPHRHGTDAMFLALLRRT